MINTSTHTWTAPPVCVWLPVWWCGVCRIWTGRRPWQTQESNGPSAPHLMWTDTQTDRQTDDRCPHTHRRRRAQLTSDNVDSECGAADGQGPHVKVVHVTETHTHDTTHPAIGSQLASLSLSHFLSLSLCVCVCVAHMTPLMLLRSSCSCERSMCSGVPSIKILTAWVIDQLIDPHIQHTAGTCLVTSLTISVVVHMTNA